MNVQTETRNTWFTMRISRGEQEKLASAARLRGVKVADVVREELRLILAGASEAMPAGAGQNMQQMR